MLATLAPLMPARFTAWARPATRMRVVLPPLVWAPPPTDDPLLMPEPPPRTSPEECACEPGEACSCGWHLSSFELRAGLDVQEQVWGDAVLPPELEGLIEFA